MPGTTPSRLITWIAVGAVVLAAGTRVFGQPAQPVRHPSPVTLEHADPDRAGRIYVDVAGAVRRPGLYRLPAGSRVGEAVERAGGLDHAAPASVNLAAPLEDGQQVKVVGRDAPPVPLAASGLSDGAALPESGVTAPAAGGTLSLATATAEQIDAAADGIGPTLATRVVQFREQSGGFSSVEDLREVPGIGEARFQALSAVFGP